MPGPLPNPQRRRKNAPTIANTVLNPAGRSGRAPSVPKRFNLGKAGKAFWAWAWKLPQAEMWDDGAIYFVARRAELEDMAVAIGDAPDVDLAELLNAPDDDRELQRIVKNLEFAIGKLKAMAGGSVGLMREMRELDNRLGLNPKAMADLRWSIAEKDEVVDKSAEAASAVASLDAYRDRAG